MNKQQRFLTRLAVPVVCATLLSPSFSPPGAAQPALAHTSLSAPQVNTYELETFLFAQDPHLQGGKKGIHVIWIPPPIEKYCLGKTHKECSTLDYCIRTTSKQVAMCQNLPVDIVHFPPYPIDSPPRRVLSITYFLPNTIAKGFDNLAKFCDNAPKGSLDRLSTRVRFKARVKLMRSAGDDDFELLEVLTVPSS